MNAAVELFLGKAAIGAGDDVFTADYASETKDAFGYELWMFHDICTVTDYTGGQNLALRQLDVLPDAPFMFVAGVGGFDEVGSGADLENEIGDFSERHVGRMRPGPASPADVVADAVFRDSFQGVVQDIDVATHPPVVIIKARGGDHAVVGHGGAGIVHLQQETGVDDGAVLRPQSFRQGDHEFFFVRVVFVLPVRDCARRGRHWQE